MVNYQQAKIYKIVDNRTDEIFIGSTCYSTLARALASCVDNYRSYVKDNARGYRSYFKFFEDNDDYDIILIENFPCNSKDELNARLKYNIKNNECVNKIIIGRTRKEYNEDNKEKLNKYKYEYQSNNKDKVKLYKSRNYIKKNPTTLFSKDYILKNFPEIKEKLKDCEKYCYDDIKTILNI